jgi:ferritin-like metal-binding protein YciE
MNLRDLLIDGLKDIYWAEKALTKALQEECNSQWLYALKNHLEETKNQTSLKRFLYPLTKKLPKNVLQWKA